MRGPHIYMTRYVLDADSIIAFLENRPGANVIEDLLGRSIGAHRPILMSVVSWGAVFQMILKSHGEAAAENKMRELQQLSIDFVVADDAMCLLAASIATKLDLPYADSFAVATARQRKATLVTLNSDAKLAREVKVLIAR